MQGGGSNGVSAWDNPVYGMHMGTESSICIENKGADSSPVSEEGGGLEGSFSAVAVATNPRYETIPSAPPTVQNGGSELSTPYHDYEMLDTEDEGGYATSRGPN